MATATAKKTKVNFRPLGDRILIEVADAEEVTAGGIVLPDSAKEKPQRGTVVAVGPGKVLDNGQHADMSIKKGNSVLYGKYSGTEIDIDGRNLIVLRETDVLGIID